MRTDDQKQKAFSITTQESIQIEKEYEINESMTKSEQH